MALVAGWFFTGHASFFKEPSRCVPVSVASIEATHWPGRTPPPLAVWVISIRVISSRVGSDRWQTQTGLLKVFPDGSSQAGVARTGGRSCGQKSAPMGGASSPTGRAIYFFSGTWCACGACGTCACSFFSCATLQHCPLSHLRHCLLTGSPLSRPGP